MSKQYIELQVLSFNPPAATVTEKAAVTHHQNGSTAAGSRARSRRSVAQQGHAQRL